MATLEHSFVSAAQLATIQTDISGAESATLTESDYSETDNGDGTYTYTAQYTTSSDSGDFTFTLTTAETSDATPATWGSQATTYSLTSTAVIDAFESGDISEYTGDTTDFAVNTNSPVTEGSHSLKSDYAGSNWVSIYSTSGLDNYPSRGDTFRAYFYTAANNDPGVFWGGADADNCYRLTIFSQYDTFRLYRIDSGSATQIATDDSATIPTDEWGYVDIEYTDPTITCTLYDSAGSQISSISADDTNYNDTGVGFGKSTDGSPADPTTAFDDVKLL